MEKRIKIVGIGPGDPELIPPKAVKIIEDCDVLVGGRRNLELFAHLQKEQLVVGNNLDQILEAVTQCFPHSKTAVLVTGDPGLYSLLAFLKGRIPEGEMEAIPGISALQYLCAQCQLTWDDLYITSVHGRKQENLAQMLREHKKTAVFAGGDSKPDRVCKQLLEQGLDGFKVIVGENLSYPNERIVHGSLEEISGLCFENLSLMLVLQDEEPGRIENPWPYRTPGISDEVFLRGEVPMTKAEVRAVSIAKLRLTGQETVWDIGAGTGSVSVECGLVCRNGNVFAVEKNPAAIGLIQENIHKFGLTNVKVIQGDAPEVLQGIPDPDRIFIGGTGGNMEPVFDWICSRNKFIRVVVNAVTVESVYETMECMEKKGFDDVEIVNIAVSKGRKAGGKHLMQALNPVYIISGERKI